MSWPINDTVKLVVGIAGNVTALGLFLAPVQTMATVVRQRSVGDFSAVPYAATLLNCLLWTFYAMPFIGEGRTLIIPVNAAGAAFEASYLLIFFVFSSPKLRALTAAYMGASLALFGTIATVTLVAFHTSEARSTFLGGTAVVVTMAMYASPLAVMRVVIRTKSVQYMPLGLSVLSLTNGAVWALYAIYVRDVFIAIPNAAGVVLGVVQVVLYVHYYRIETAATSRSESRRRLTAPSFSLSFGRTSTSTSTSKSLGHEAGGGEEGAGGTTNGIAMGCCNGADDLESGGECVPEDGHSRGKGGAAGGGVGGGGGAGGGSPRRTGRVADADGLADV